ncbi:amino acid permease-domain-containing protein [Earliella scabrosa]|nr:amino acid permease-domain-containing protein [Earliella scabrosa]
MAPPDPPTRHHEPSESQTPPTAIVTTMPFHEQEEVVQLRERKSNLKPGLFNARVRIQDPHPPPRPLWHQQRQRILQFQRRWDRIRSDLPPQLSRKHVGMISIGGVIGIGLFVGSADALRNGGPVGAVLGYTIVGTVVYCLCVSIGEMIAFLPNVGGVVGLADLYVDPALGFSLGWAAWYNWSVTLPAEITAAAVVISFWDEQAKLPVAAIGGVFLTIATIVNCFPSRVYGEMEYYLSCMKVITIVVIVLLCLLIDMGVSSAGPIGFRNWITKPFPDSYLGIGGHAGHFLGFWAVIMQASFSFFGSEVPGIAAGEVIDATRNVPRALRKVWIRITLFYIGGVFSSGLVVPSDHVDLRVDDGTGRRSPFVIAFKIAGWTGLSHAVNAAILLSAWSAAASDIYISSRFLFFLARRGHAPNFLAHLFRYPSSRAVSSQSDSDTDRNDRSDADSDSDDDTAERELNRDTTGLRENELLGQPPVRPQKHTYVMPLASVLVSASVGLLTFLSYGKTGNAETVFNWLVSVASVASLQSWAGMLFTYIRWHQGTVYYERKHKGQDTEAARNAQKHIADIKKNRQWGQPYLAWYAFILCMLVLFTNGWAVFVHQGWRIANVIDTPSVGADLAEEPASDSTLVKLSETERVSLFLSAYVPLPFFLLLTFGYKLIKQTEMIPLEKMTFDPGDRPDPEADVPKGKLEKLLAWLMII